jgi:hypothetical protein
LTKSAWESDLDKSDFDKPSKPGKAPKPAPDYDTWLAYGKKLADQHSGHQWKLGDWLVLGQGYFDPKTMLEGIPSHMLISRGFTGADGEKHHKSIVKMSQFWDDIEKAIGMGISTLKQYAQVSRAYPKKKRFKTLGWSHHMVACSYERRYEYLKACLNVPEGQRPHPISWLLRLIAKEEGDESSARFAKNFVRIPIDDETYLMLKDLAKYYGTDIAEIASVPFKAALEVFLAEQKKKVWIDFHGCYEEKRHDRWPFTAFQTRRQRTQFWGNRRHRPMQRDTAFSKAQKARALASWDKRRARRHNGLSFQITRRSTLGQVA